MGPTHCPPAPALVTAPLELSHHSRSRAFFISTRIILAGLLVACLRGSFPSGAEISLAMHVSFGLLLCLHAFPSGSVLFW